MKNILFLILVIITGCSTQVIEPNNSNSLEKIIKNFDESSVKNEIERPDTKTNVNEISFSITDPHLNAKVKYWVDYFSLKDRKRFQRHLNRGQIYKEVVETILEEHGLPADLYYLAMIESGYVSTAKSKARAVGVWQFIKGTASRYSLDINPYVDERKDPVRSTEAAAKYLRDLFNAFNSWELAMASYNCGEFRVLQAVMKGDSRDFWELVDKKLLPKETRNYIPKFIAATIIGKNPEKYGFEIETEPQEKYPDIVSVEVPSPIKLKEIAKQIDISEESVLKTNPHLIKGITPPNYSKYEIWIPKIGEEKFNLIANDLTKYKVKSKIKPLKQEYDKHYYVVKSGDTLSNIAIQTRESVRHLASINNLKGSRIYPGQKLRLTTNKYKSSGNSEYYFVKSGDNLGNIARKHGTTIKLLKRLNGLSSTRIFVGQKLIVGGDVRGKYKVRRGDNLHKIARNFGVSVNQLKKLNNLNRSTIFVGQVLRVN